MKTSAGAPPIMIKGNKFFYSNSGTQFYLKGIAYQQTLDGNLLEQQKKEFLKEKLRSIEMASAVELSNDDESFEAASINPSLDSSDFSYLTDENLRYSDPLADEKSCIRDIPYLVDLNVNVIRVYSINPLENHDVCMNALSEAGIYVMADLSEPFTSINRKYPSWNTKIYDRYKSVIDSMSKYNNVLGFFAGNEVTNDHTNTDASPFVKAAIRDTKAYISEKNYRKIPVGYSSNDDADTRVPMATYFNCGDKETTADFYGINMYEWCGYSSFFSSGYSERTREFKNYTIPIFFSEFGCNLVRPRPFQEVEALYSPLMTSVWSGGIAYMYHEEENKYGVVKVDKNENTVKKMDDYKYLQKAYGNAKPKLLNIDDMSKNLNTEDLVNCPDPNDVWKAAQALPPTPNSSKCECLEKSLECVASASKNTGDFVKLYGILCHEVDCSEIVGNGTTGEYGYYSDCDEKQKLSYILNEYYLKYYRDPQSCDFKGQASLARSSSKKSMKNTCDDLLLKKKSGKQSEDNGKNSAEHVDDDVDDDHENGQRSAGNNLKVDLIVELAVIMAYGIFKLTF
ncbi:1,3-beta-glucanosyltransferase [Saccharomycopsis crataegensis]|uniref:1,3-beta-glucanosyltransferase n=1 Tax=Saccharomycopsis crataegensis TaxID=43959 RepID=A0AAV5QUB7_9ASCO|nr:1,3-beta-glucanosyltransferase [Saccharomycopsis crataegensis]